MGIVVSPHALSNAIRLGLTLSLGLVSVALVARLGASALAVYLFVLGWRWLVQFLIDAAEAASVSCRGDGKVVQRSQLIAVAFLAAVVSLIAFPVGWRLFGVDQALVLAAGVIANIMVIGSQILTAGGMAAFVLKGDMKAYGRMIVFRRGTEFLALLAGLGLGASPDAVLIWQSGLLAGASVSLMAVVLPPVGARPGQDRAVDFGPRIIRSALVGLSTSVAARAPAVLLPAFGGVDYVVPAGVMVLCLGYVRQAGSVFLAGLDGLARQTGLRTVVVQQTRFVGGLGLVGFVGAYLILPNLLTLLLPPSALPEYRLTRALLLGLRLLLLGAVLRLVAEVWIKVLTGFGALAGSEKRAAFLTGAYLAGLAGMASLTATVEPVIIAAAVGYIGLQIGLIAYAFLPTLSRFTGISRGSLLVSAMVPLLGSVLFAFAP